LEFLVAENIASFIIGIEGTNVSALQNDSGANVSVS
jgi:hypothetical protein